MEVSEAIAVGVAAGLVAGLLGVGGGILFVPALVFIRGLSQVEAEATSLLAIVPVALVGAWRQHGYGNVRLREGVTVGALAIPGAALGVTVANVLPERTLELAFAALLVAIAVQLVTRTLRSPAEGPAAAEEPAETG
jgi:uncharacterized membrane protein YfcA